MKLAEIESEVKKELSEEIVIEGGYQPPKIERLFVVLILKLPISLPLFLLETGKYWYTRHYLKEELSLEDQQKFTAQAFHTTWDGLQEKIGKDELDRVLECKVYENAANLKRFEEEMFMRKKPGQYKRYKRWKKNQ